MKQRFFHAGLILIPIFLLILLEGMLRLFALGPDTRLFVPVNKSAGIWGVNPNVVLRYFPVGTALTFGAENLFYQPKRPDTYRIIALGGSTVAGFPYHYNGSFPARLKQYLEAGLSHGTIEMINLGLSAVNSHTVRDLLDEVLAIDPDLIIIYSGHNEFYGALGSAAEKGPLRVPAVKQWLLQLEKTRLYQTIRGLVHLLHRDRNINSQTLMAAMSEGQVFPPGDVSRSATFDQFENNLKFIISRVTGQHVPLVLCTVASNLRNQRPFRSLPELRLAGYTADELYLAGQNALIAGQDSLAQDYFTLARDMDAMPFRAPSAINRIIRDLATQSGVAVADVETAFQTVAHYGIPGDSLFLEHVHPTPAGFDLMAKTILETLRLQPELFGFTDSLLSPDRDPPFRITALDSAIARFQLDILTSHPPFTSHAGPTLRDIVPGNIVEEIARDVLLGKRNFKSGHLALAAHYQSLSQHDNALRECQALVAALPMDKAGYRALISAGLTAGRGDVVRPAAEALLALDSLDALANKWGGIYALQDHDTDQALIWLRRAKRLKDDDQVRYNFSGALFAKGKLKAAAAELDTLLKRNPEHAQARSFRAFLRARTSFK